MAREMPALERFFHYRNLDVSTLKILATLWAPTVAAGFNKESTHRALADIRDSMAELVTLIGIYLVFHEFLIILQPVFYVINLQIKTCVLLPLFSLGQVTLVLQFQILLTGFRPLSGYFRQVAIRAAR